MACRSMSAACVCTHSFREPVPPSQTPHMRSAMKTAPATTLVVPVHPGLVADVLASEASCVAASEVL